LNLKFQKKEKNHREMYTDILIDKTHTLNYCKEQSSYWADHISLKRDKMSFKNNYNNYEIFSSILIEFGNEYEIEKKDYIIILNV